MVLGSAAMNRAGCVIGGLLETLLSQFVFRATLKTFPKKFLLEILVDAPMKRNR
jgi:hypothetical protein